MWVNTDVTVMKNKIVCLTMYASSFNYQLYTFKSVPIHLLISYIVIRVTIKYVKYFNSLLI